MTSLDTESINRIHYCAPVLSNVLKTIAPTLQNINNKYQNCFDWDEDQEKPKMYNGTGTHDIPEVVITSQPQPVVSERKALWTPLKLRRGPHDFSSKF